MKNKILITGARGFIGDFLVNLLDLKRFKLNKFLNSSTLNLCNWDLVSKTPKSDLIIHLAAKNFVPDSFLNPLDFYNNNISSTLNILEKARKDNSRVIFFSTYVYGIPEYLPVDEKHQSNPLNPYTQSKLICEQLCMAYNRDFGIPITIFRPFNVYGPGQNPSFFIPSIIKQINNDFIYLDDSRPKRDYIYVDDVISAIYKCIINENLSDSFNVYNLGTGISTSVKDVAELILEVSQSKSKLIFSNKVRKGEVLETKADIKKIKKDLKWNYKISLREGIEKIINKNKVAI